MTPTQSRSPADERDRYAEEFAYSGDLCICIANLELRRLRGFYEVRTLDSAEQSETGAGV